MDSGLQRIHNYSFLQAQIRKGNHTHNVTCTSHTFLVYV